jgi:hypothetical protein
MRFDADGHPQQYRHAYTEPRRHVSYSVNLGQRIDYDPAYASRQRSFQFRV